jgi:hypothetical protein
MPPFLSGPGLGLPLPQNLYPTALGNAPLDNPSNRVCLAPGQELPIAAGDWYIGLGSYLVLEYFDPVNNIWTMAAAAGWTSGMIHATSDGFNLRVANRLGCPVSATVIQYGTSYVQGTTTVTQISTSAKVVGTWAPIVGGQLVFSGASVTTSQAGAGYGVPPLIFIPPPAPAASNSNGVGGIQASAYAVIANGTVSTVSFVNQGAGYGSGFTIVCQPNPTDPNLATGITNATVYFSLSSLNTNGGIAGVLCTNPGGPLGNGSMSSITLSIGGAGTGASVVANVLQTIVSTSITGAGVGTGLLPVLTVGGVPSTSPASSASPEALGLAWRPRQPNIGTSVTANSAGTVYDGGLFLGAPTAWLFPAPGATVSIGTVALTLGSVPDIAVIQPAA